MKISVDTHSRRHTANIRVLDKNGKPIEGVIGLDTETNLLTLIDTVTHVRHTQLDEFTVVDARTGLPLTSEQVADIEKGAHARSEQLVDELLNDLADRDTHVRNNFDVDSEARAQIADSWVKIIERWR